jgi:hypothetical protein
LAPRFVDLHEWVSEIVDIAGVAGRTQIIVIANGASVTDACEELPSTAVTVALMFIVSRRLRAWPSCGCQARSRGRHERVKECIEERFAFTFGAPRTGGAGTNAIFAIAMTAMLRPKNSSSYAFHRISVELLQPRRLEEHDFGHTLHLACNNDVPLKRDDIAGSRKTDECVGGISSDFAFVVTEEDLANEEIRAQFDCGFENDGNTSWAKEKIMFVSNKVILQDVQTNSDGDTVQVVHETSDIVVGDNGRYPIIRNVE